MTKSTISGLLVRGIILFLVPLGAACGSGSNPPAPTKAYPNIIPVIRDADVSTIDAPVGAEAGSSAPPSTDATQVDSWRSSGDPNVFPTCTGTPEQVSDCIINLQTRGAIAVTRADPAACQP
jgi:hypothetical protein